ncbi:DUF5712 family protein [Adhaeribacter rhizoryzae]|uniref:Mobilization protein n=1 Tax=Adhaeribacter rhizoryzae TaxID=2607907 RepID=A0A5M6CXL6_9BACT|nr:DUF5712 family protein [Adhaeribacter rhizoryzae]KAA5538742.1 hypothetical protein F0145_25710 [Adhaeribacter rhizoryzae]
MYVKLIDPKTHGKAAYNNKGSCLQTINYLIHEARKDRGEVAIFFNQDDDFIRPEYVQQAIDNNTKGLRVQEQKFYSLIISPSENELMHIHNNEQLLKDYTRQVIKLYAGNFNLQGGRNLQSEDLIWFGTIHQKREYRGTDKDVLAGKALVGERRPGLQTHIHFIVSARDREQKITLNPGGRRSRFNLMKWQQSAGQQFEQQFNYIALEREKLKVRERDSSRDSGRAKRIEERIEFLNLQLPKEGRLEVERVKQIAVKREYDKTFYRSLKHLENKAVLGSPLHHPYHFLKTGKEKQTIHRAPLLQARQLLSAIETITYTSGRQKTKTENIGENRGKRKGEIEID